MTRAILTLAMVGTFLSPTVGRDLPPPEPAPVTAPVVAPTPDVTPEPEEETPSRDVATLLAEATERCGRAGWVPDLDVTTEEVYAHGGLPCEPPPAPEPERSLSERVSSRRIASGACKYVPDPRGYSLATGGTRVRLRCPNV